MLAANVQEREQKLAYSLKEAAQLSSLSEATLKRCLRDGRLGSVRVGRRRLIPARALHDFLSPEGRNDGTR